MPETIVVKGEHGLPYSKGLMAQSLSASGVAPERAYEVARALESRLAEAGRAEIPVAELRSQVAEVLREREGPEAAERFLDWEDLTRLDRPLVVLLGGAPGVGKSTLATLLAGRVGITRVIATDAIRHVIRAFFSHDLMPAVHYSSFEAGAALDPVPGLEGDRDIAGYLRQVESVRTGAAAILDRALLEGTPMILEGVHIVPGSVAPALRERCVLVEAVVAIEQEDAHRSHFLLRGGDRPADRYLDRFAEIRKLQDYLVERAQAAGAPVIEAANMDVALSEAMELVRGAVGAELRGGDHGAAPRDGRR
ncbi:MAG: zeta toxin family protein [Actinobacteria bacterium]|nr:zeta toxin family protein [Actinomycetota bacterium]